MQFRLSRVLASAAGASLILVAACISDAPTPTPPTDQPETGLPGDDQGAAGGEDNTFDHPGETDPWDILDRLLAEGPPSYSAHVHSCMKMKYATLGRVLTSRGVNIAATAATSAGGLYVSGQQALGTPTYAQRVPEATELTTAGASRILDIYASAASEIITAMPNRAECSVGGTPTQMFDAAGACTARGIACITGMPASPAQIELCSNIVTSASNPTKGRNMAVAVTMAAAQICE